MKRILAIIFMLCVVGLSVYAAPKTMYVSVKEAQLKNGTGFFAKETGTVKYADKVSVLDEDGKWVKISVYSKPSVSGWILKSSLTKKKLIANKSKTSASTKELALAGKGLTEGSGNEFKTSGAKNYSGVDYVEKNKTTKPQLHSFIVDGKLKDGE